MCFCPLIAFRAVFFHSHICCHCSCICLHIQKQIFIKTVIGIFILRHITDICPLWPYPLLSGFAVTSVFWMCPPWGSLQWWWPTRRGTFTWSFHMEHSQTTRWGNSTFLFCRMTVSSSSGWQEGRGSGERLNTKLLKTLLSKCNKILHHFYHTDECKPKYKIKSSCNKICDYITDVFDIPELHFPKAFNNFELCTID